MARRAQGRKPNGSERPPLAPWLSLAAAAHGALLAAALAANERAFRRNAAPTEAAAPSDAAVDPTWLDLIVADSAEASAGSRPSMAPPSSAALDDTVLDDTAVDDAAVDDTAVDAAAPPRLVALGARHVRPSRDARPNVEASAQRGGPGDAVKPEPAAPGGDSGADPAAASEGIRRGLSLRELGVERGSNPFIGSPTELPTERQLYNQRLRRSLREGIAKQDQARGLGPEGPAVTAVTDIVMASATAPNTTALLRVRADGAGLVTRVDVLEADRDSAEWQRIADELVRALAAKRLRVPAGGNGVSFQLRVVSRVQLPSGADPGLAVDVLGIPLKKGDGERSTKLSILSPMVTEIEVPNSNGLRVPVVTFSLIGGVGDPTDIGAVARRLVTAYLVAMDTDDLPANAAPAAPPPAGAATR